MKEYFYSKIISGIIIISLSIGTALLPVSTVYATTTGGSGYTSGGGYTTGGGYSTGSPYSFNYSNIFTSGVIGSVIGCTGIANTISRAITGLLNPAKLGADAVGLVDTVAGKAFGVPGSGGRVPVTDAALTDKAKDTNKIASDAESRTACLNGIAYQLAKRQLADITAKTVSWINGGYMGDPMYILSSPSYMQTIANQEIRSITSIYADPKNNFLYPYGLAFAQGAVLEARNKAQYFGTSTLNAFFANGNKRLMNGSTPQTRDFATNFSLGGWAGWNLLTQQPQNNPLGFTMQASQRLADTITGKTTDTQNEINRNGGFLDQKVCVQWDGQTKSGPQAGGTDYIPLPPGTGGDSGTRNANIYPLKAITPTTSPKGFDIINKAEAAGTYSYQNGVLTPDDYGTLDEYGNTISSPSSPITNNGVEQKTTITDTFNTTGVGNCVKYKTITPGSIIADQTKQLTSSEIRQLELANDINSSLNQIFTAALTQITTQGLNGLAKAFAQPSDQNPNQGNDGTNRIFDASGNDITNSSQNYNSLFAVGNSSGWSNDGSNFDITTDLGWKIARDSAGNVIRKPLVYAVNDKGITMDGRDATHSPVTYVKNQDGTYQDGIGAVINKGVIQTQQQYLDIVSNYSMPRTWEIAGYIGALDYCLPGPNPLWETSTHQAVDAAITFLKDSYFDTNTNSVVTPDVSTLNSNYAGVPGTQLNGYDVATNVLYTVAAIGLAVPGFGWIISAVAGTAAFIVGIVGSQDEQAAQDKIQKDLLQNAANFADSQATGIATIKQTFSNYYDQITPLYGSDSPMMSSTTGKETQYLPMAQAGAQMTRNLTNYYLTIKQADSDYATAIDQTKSNIYKLQQIKAKVDKIVLAAKARQCAEDKGTWSGTSCSSIKYCPIPATSILDTINTLGAVHVVDISKGGLVWGSQVTPANPNTSTNLLFVGPSVTTVGGGTSGPSSGPTQ